ncbi:hypothetical protein NSQ54_10230 [Alkalihalobacillus sp. FSL W8-0930]
MKRRWIACIACLISILGLFSLQLYFQAESKEEVLDLSNESLNQIRLNTPITEFEPSKLMIVNDDTISNYAHTFEYEQMLISFDSSNQVVHLTSLHPEVETSKGISLGDSLEDVIDQYGEVTEQKEVETHIQKMIYRDHEVELSFYVTNDVVEQIELHSTQ